MIREPKFKAVFCEDMPILPMKKKKPEPVVIADMKRNHVTIEWTRYGETPTPTVKLKRDRSKKKIKCCV